MPAWFAAFVSWLTGTMLGKLISTAALSMVPIVELRGGIPFGVALGLEPWQALCASIVGNLIPVPFIMLFLQSIFGWLRKYKGSRNFIEKLENKAHIKGELVRKYSAIGLLLLVAIPLPGTGAWTGALVASVLKLPKRLWIPCIFFGVVIAGVLITALTYGVTALI